MQAISSWLRYCQPQMIAALRELVLCESPTHDKAACDQLSARLASEFAALGGEVKIHRQPTAGDHLQVDFPGREPRRPVMLLGHFDTVYGLGTLPSMPWSERDGRLYGPGVFDMKAGIVQMMFAIAALREVAGELPRPVKVWLVSDEEAGSASSRAMTESLARECAAVLVCEPSGPGGALKTARKGVGGFTLKVTGVAAHSGLDFEKGHSAIVELAHQIRAIERLTNLDRGITMNVGIVRGGTRTNVVAAEATAEIDLRVARPRRWRRDGSACAPASACQSQLQTGDHGRHQSSAAGAYRAGGRALRAGARTGRRARVRSWRKPPWAAARTATSPPESACRRSTAWARSATALTPRMSMSSPPNFRAGQRCWPD